MIRVNLCLSVVGFFFVLLHELRAFVVNPNDKDVDPQTSPHAARRMPPWLAATPPCSQVQTAALIGPR
jgi:hypothetical protein